MKENFNYECRMLNVKCKMVAVIDLDSILEEINVELVA
jgi:hypothetical protein